MKSKPIIINETMYLFNLRSFYASVHPGQILYTLDSKRNNCQWAKTIRKELCRPAGPNQCGSSMMDYILRKSISTEKCLTKIADGNYMTHSLHQVHFTIRKPMLLNISCSNETQTLRLNKSCSLVDASNCIISIDKIKYKINNTVEYEILKLSSNTSRIQSIRKWINISFLIIILLVAAIMGCALIEDIANHEGDVPEGEFETTPNSTLIVQAQTVNFIQAEIKHTQV